MMKWATRALIAGVSVSLFFWATVAGVMVADRAVPTTVLSSTVLTPEVAQGGLLRIDYQVYRLRTCRVLIERVIFDGEGNRVILPDVDFESAGPVGVDHYVSPTVVPLAAAVGKAKYRVTLSYYCNVIHRLFWPIVDVRPDLEFYITPAKVKESSNERDPSPLSIVPTSLGYLDPGTVDWDVRVGQSRNAPNHSRSVP